MTCQAWKILATSSGSEQHQDNLFTRAGHYCEFADAVTMNPHAITIAVMAKQFTCDGRSPLS